MKRLLVDFGKHVFLEPVLGTLGALGLALWGVWRLAWFLIEGAILLGWCFYTMEGVLMILFGAGTGLHLLKMFCYFGGAYILARMLRYALGYPMKLFIYGLPSGLRRPAAPPASRPSITVSADVAR